MVEILIKLFNTINQQAVNKEELMKFFRSEYKNNANNAYEYWISTRKSDFLG